MSTTDQLLAAELRDLRRRIAALESSELPIATKGSWTPVIAGTTIAGTFTYATQVGRYAQIGNRVLFNLTVAISAIAVGPTGTLTITGLPFTPDATANVYHGCSLGYVGSVPLTAGTYLTAIIDPGVAKVRFIENAPGAGGNSYNAANFTNPAAFIAVSGQYNLS